MQSNRSGTPITTAAIPQRVDFAGRTSVGEIGEHQQAVAARSFPDAGQLSFLPLHIVLTGLVVLAGLTTLSLRLYEPDASHDPIAIGCGLGVMGLMLYVRYTLRVPWISPSVVYLMLFWMFHYGLVFTAVLVPDVLAPFPYWENAWMYWPNVRVAMLLGLIGAAGFVFGVGLMTAGWHNAGHAKAAEIAHDPALYGVGWVVMLVGLGGTLFTLLAHGGLGVFTLSYAEFRFIMLGPTNLQTFVDHWQLGCLLALCGAGGRRWVRPLAAFTPLACIMLLVGLRSEAMVPLVSYAIVLRYRGVRFHRGWLAAVALTSLVAIPAIRVVRDVGFSNRSLVNWTEVSPLETFTEFGGTLRSAKAYVDFIEEGDEYLLGASYWAPFDRQLLVRMVPGRERIPFEEDVRVPSRMMSREGAVGDSSTGEAYYNFGPVGPFIYFACVGALFGWLERQAAATPYGCALLGIAMSSFYFNIRGSWLAVPAQMGWGLALVGCCYMVGRFTFARSVNSMSDAFNSRSGDRL